MISRFCLHDIESQVISESQASYKKAYYNLWSSTMCGFCTLQRKFLGNIWKPQFPHCNVSLGL